MDGDRYLIITSRVPSCNNVFQCVHNVFVFLCMSYMYVYRYSDACTLFLRQRADLKTVRWALRSLLIFIVLEVEKGGTNKHGERNVLKTVRKGRCIHRPTQEE
jgi:hypothetical protein